MRNRTKTDVIRGMFGYKLFLLQHRHILQSVKIFLIVDVYPTVVVGVDTKIIPMRRKTPKK